MMNNQSLLSHLECSECFQVFDTRQLQSICPSCNSPLLARYDLNGERNKLDIEEIQSRKNGMWRWQELLPVEDTANIVSLGEGDSPLLLANKLGKAFGLKNLYIKDESGQPTGTFKARGLAMAVSKGIELGVHDFVIPTAGNAGGALAAYASRAGVNAHVYMPQDAPAVNIVEVRSYGADLHLVDGLISDAGKLASEAATENGWFDVSTLKEPYRLEGKKTMGLEVAKDFNWDLPDVIIYPTGGGTGLIGMWKAFRELQSLGWIDEHLPKMVSVQALGCSPIVKAFKSNANRAIYWENASTIAAGLRVPLPFADRLILRILYESEGNAVAVSDKEIIEAQSQLARLEGVFAAPEGAATLAAINELIRQGWIEPEARIVLYNTGTGLKYVS